MTTFDNRLATLAETASALAREFNLDAVLQTIVDAAGQLTGARYSALGVIGEDQTIRQFITQGAADDVIRAIGHYPRGKGLLGLVIRDPEVLRVDDIAGHPASHGFPPNHPPMANFLGTPVRSGGTVYGNLYVTEKPGGFDAEDEQFLVVMAAQAGAAVENAQLSEKLQSLAVQDERDRISRELHDGVIQALFSIGMSLESARALLVTDLPRVEQRLTSAVDGLDDVIRDLRNSIFSLRPHEAAALGLTRGIGELAREYEVNALVSPELLLSAGLDQRVPDAVVADVLQIVREALSNIARHAKASTVTIAGIVHDDTFELSINDGGAGFDLAGVKTGHGLRNMTERAEAMHGTLHVASVPGEGTQLLLQVPL